MKKSGFLFILIFSCYLYSSNYMLYRDRRTKIQSQLGPSTAMVIVTAKVYPRNGDVKYEFRPNSDFWYLTGHPEPKAKLLLVGKNFKGKNKIPFSEEVIFTQPRNPQWEVWTGKRLGVNGVKEKLGFQYVTVIDSFESVLNKVFPYIDTLYVNTTESSYFNHEPPTLREILPQIKSDSITILNAGLLIHPLRRIKSQEEIKLIQKAIDITKKGILSAIKRTKPKLAENNIEATIEFEFRDNGSERLGFPSIVGSGPNTTILHYVENNRMMKFKDLLLMDVGAEYHMYTADITRTIPVSGRFSYEQRELYSYVLETQKITFDSIKLGMTLKDLNQIARNHLEEKGFGKYFIHGIGHWLGLDVHDVGGRDAKIEIGSVFTIEPGIYIAEDDTTAPKKYRGIGIRIEDDVLMTENGPKWLSADIPKEIDEIELIMRRATRHRQRSR